MKRRLFPTLILALLIGFATAAAQPPASERYSTDDNKEMKRVSVKGKIEKITDGRAVLKTERGEKITVHLGPQRFWRDKGYRLAEGAQVTVDGWGEIYDDDGGYLFAGTIYGDGFSFELMNEYGYPRWAREDDWDDDWYPCRANFHLYFGRPWGYGPWGYWGPPPRWWHRPPWWYHHHRPHCPPPPPRHHRHGGWR